MLHCLSNPVLIVDADVRYSGRIRSHIDKDQRHLVEAKMLDQGVFHAEGQKRDTVDPALNHAAD